MKHPRFKEFVEDVPLDTEALPPEKRLHILQRLAEGEISLGELAPEVGVNREELSQHLAKLRKLGLLQTRRAGPTIYYRRGP